MEPSRQYSVVIIGGGYSGSMMAVNLIRQGLPDHHNILIINRKHPMAKGLAYDTWDDNLLLNGPVGTMSALEDSPNHFLNYCQALDPALNESSFVPRRIYGDYLQDTFVRHIHDRGHSIETLEAEVTSVQRRTDSPTFRVSTGNGLVIDANAIVLANGHAYPRLPQCLQHLPSSRQLVINPLISQDLDQLPDDRPILILGTGHTSIDAVFRLTSTNRRKVILLGRRGQLPIGHSPTLNLSPKVEFPCYLEMPKLTARACLNAIRKQISIRKNKGGDWRDVINELRHHVPTIWQRLDLSEKQRFVRHLSSLWNSHRYRLSPIAYHRFQQLKSTGRVEVIAGRLLTCMETSWGYRISIQNPKTEIKTQFEVGGIINCTGLHYDLKETSQTLNSQLAEEGLIRRDPSGQGIEISDDYCVIGQDGSPISNFYYFGPFLKAKFWEAISVPELRGHGKSIAINLIGSLTAPS